MLENTSTITQTILSTINSLFSSLFSSVDNNIYEVLDDIVFINSDILEDQFMSKFLGTSITSRINFNCKFTAFRIFVVLHY